MNKFAPHFQRFSAEMRDLIARWQPPFVVWVDPNQSGVDEIRRVSPGTFIIGRKNEAGHDWRPDSSQRLFAMARKLIAPSSLFAVDWDYQTSPEWWADECAIMAQCDAYLYNEPISHDEKHLFAAFDEWQTRFRVRLLEHGIECVGLNVGTGNFTKLDNIAECFPRTCATFKYLGIHEYDWIIDPAKRPFDIDRQGYYWLRWPYWLQDIDRDDVTLWITECGMTQAVHGRRPDEGWRSGADGMTDDDYIAWADWYSWWLISEERIGGAALFNFSGWGWETFEHLGWGRLDEILALDAEPPGGNGGEMNIEVYDRDNNLRDWDWLVEHYGPVEVHPVTEIYQPSEGEIVYQVAYFREKTGDAGCIINVRDLDGNPIQGETVMWGWPDVEAHGYGGKPWDWTEGKGRSGDTNENGDVGPGMSTDSYYTPPGIGPHWIWVWDRPSEFVKGIGMIAGTFHDHLDVGYHAIVWGGEEPQPPPQGDLAEELATIGQSMIEDGQRVKEIAGLIGNGFAPSKMTLESGDGRTATYTLTEVE